MADTQYTQPDPAKPIIPRPEDKPGEYEQAVEDWVQLQDAPNLVPFFLQSEEGRKFLGKVATQVCDDFKRDWDGSEEYRTIRKDNYRLFTGFLKAKTFPFPGCANAHRPLMMERILRLSANVFAEIFNDRDTIFSVRPTGPDDYETAEVLSLHGNWQLRNEITDFLRQQERAMQEFFTAGSVFCHSYYDPIARQNRHDILNCEEFVIPYVWVTNRVDLSDVPRKTRILRKYRGELEDLRDAEEAHAWSQIDYILSKEPPGWDVLDVKNREQSAQREGIVAPPVDPTAPYVFYEYHGTIRFPGEKSQRPICATVESQNKVVTRLYIREEEDWRDRMRYDGQAQELQTFQADLQEHQAAAGKQEELRMRLQAPDIDPEERMLLEQGLAADELQPPEPPPWLAEAAGVDEMGVPQPRPVRRLPVEPFTHGVCIDNPSGALGLGYGTILADHNRLSNEALNRFYDAATLANIQCYIVPESLDLGTSSLQLVPGKVFRAKGVTGEQLKNMIVELRASPANTQLLDVLRIADEDADSAVAAPGVMSGEPGKSGETFRGIATRMERATKQLSATAMRYLSFLDRIVVNNARLNSIFLPEHELIQIGNHFQDIRNLVTGQSIAIGRDMYRRSYSVSFTADVRFTSQAQRISEADEMVQLALTVNQVAPNPALLYEAAAEAMRARGKQNLIPALGPKPPPPQIPMGMAPPPGPLPSGPETAPPEGEPPTGEGEPAGVPLPAGITGGIQGPRPELDQVQA